MKFQVLARGVSWSRYYGLLWMWRVNGVRL